MATARSLIVRPGQLGHFHCTARVVQQMFLCGHDRTTGKNYDHRRDWIQARIEELATIFAVSIHGFAVMSNHLHLVLTVDPGHVGTWSDMEVAQRAGLLYRRADETNEERLARALVWRDIPERIAALRVRLGSLSHFMAALSYPIARAANLESGKKGHFWDKRFYCQRLEDESALLSAMVYVDLNPIRAGLAEDLSSSDHTSAQLRINAIETDRRLAADGLLPVFGPYRRQLLPLNHAQYLDLVDQTGRDLHPRKRGRIAAQTPPILRQLGMSQSQWRRQVLATESRFCRAIGSLDSLMQLAEHLGQRWVRGITFARANARNG